MLVIMNNPEADEEGDQGKDKAKDPYIMNSNSSEEEESWQVL